MKIPRLPHGQSLNERPTVPGTVGFDRSSGQPTPVSRVARWRTVIGIVMVALGVLGAPAFDWIGSDSIPIVDRPGANSGFSSLPGSPSNPTPRGGIVYAQEEIADDKTFQEEDVLVYQLIGIIDDGLIDQMIREVTRVVDQYQAKHVIFYLDTDGGELEATKRGSSFILELQRVKAVGTYAFVPPKGRAFSAGTMLAFSCQRIYMGSDSRLGDVAPVRWTNFGGIEELPEKVQTVVRERLTSSAATNGYPRAIAESMVSKRFEVYQLRGGRIDDEEFVTKEVLDNHVRTFGGDRERRKLAPKLVVGPGSLLTISEREAFDYGINSLVAERVDDVMQDLALPGRIWDAQEDLGLQMAGAFGGEAAYWSKAFLVHSFTRFFLVTAGIVLIAIEFMFPSLLAALFSLLAFGLYFLGGYLNGTVGWLELVVFLAAGILVGLEVFVIPGFGVAGLLGLGCLFASLVMALRTPEEMTGQIFFDDSVSVVGAMTVGVILIAVVFRFLPKTTQGGVISGATLSDRADPPGATGTTTGNYDFLVNQRGIVAAPLRPSGRIVIGDHEYDVVAEGGFVEAGTETIVSQVEGNRIVVRPVTEDDEPAEASS